MKSYWLASVIASILMASAPSSRAADIPRISDLASYDGPDRTQRLIEEAKKEGPLSVYTSISSPVAKKLQEGFEKKYGLKVRLWRSGDRTVLQKIVSESKSSASGFDVVNIGSLEMEMLYRESLLQPVKTSLTDKLTPGSIAPHQNWVATFVNPIVLAYNTSKIKKDELPKTYEDLLNPRWKGKLGIEATDQEWFYVVVREMGQEKGLKFFRDLTSTTGLSVRNGHSLLNNLVVAGEVPLGVTVYLHSVISAQKKGAPIDWSVLAPTVGASFSMGISNTPSNPNAALLFYEYMLTDGQQVFADMNYMPTNTDIETPFRSIKYINADKSRFLDDFNKWDRLWQQTVLQRK